jgi:competence protein ComEC
MKGALTALFIAATTATAHAAPLQVYFFDVGEGDATLIISPTGKSVLIDAGPASAGQELRKRLEGLLSAPLDYALLTHSHLDHLGGMTEALNARGARQFIDSGYTDASAARHDLDEYLRSRGIAVTNAVVGQKLDLGGGASLTVVSPAHPFLRGTRSDVHANSLVVRVDFERLHLLFAGDIEVETEARLLDHSAESLKADVLKVARHGASTGSTAAFLKAVHPDYAVVSVGAGNSLDLPSGDALARLVDAGARVLRTDVDGELYLTSDGTHYSLGPTPPPAPPPAVPEPPKQVKVVASKHPNLFHTLECPAGKKLHSNNRIVFPSREAALKAGKLPARDCNP